MRVLWVVNTLFPFPAKKIGVNYSFFGGWMIGLMNTIIKYNNIELAVATTYNGKEILQYDDYKVKYYLIPYKDNCSYDKKSEIYWKKLVNDFKPDIVHLHGTEFAHGLALLNACPNIISVVSVQGLISQCGELYLSGITKKDIIRNITLRDIIKRDSMYNTKNKFLKRGEYEREILQKANYIIGRTSWDYSKISSITNSKKYYACNESLRDSFYNQKWNYSIVKKNTIFVSQASYPIKGFHYMIRALSIVVKKYPDIKVFVAGNNVIDRSSLKKKIKINGYGKYIIKLMKKTGVYNNVEFIGLKSEKEIIDCMLHCNLFVQSSVLENSPNSLGEAMIIGMPIVASDVGGTKDMLIDEKEGLLYDFSNANELANKIIRILDNPHKSIEMGNNAQIHAKETHNREKNAKRMLEIYKEVLSK